MHHYCTVRQGTLTVALLLLAAPDIRAAVEHGGLVEGVTAKRFGIARDQARADIFDYIEMFYNRRRRHSHLGDVSPEAFEQASKCSGAVSV